MISVKGLAPLYPKIDVVIKDVRYGGTVYEAAVTVGGKDYGVVVAEDGTLVEKALIIEEEEVELAACPAAVRKALRDQSQGGEVGAVTRSTGLAGHVYEAVVETHGKRYVIEVTEGGTLISKALNEDDEEEGD